MSRRRILVFAPLLPVPVDRGDKNRLFHLLQLLRSLADVAWSAVSGNGSPQSRISACSTGLTFAYSMSARRR